MSTLLGLFYENRVEDIFINEANSISKEIKGAAIIRIAVVTKEDNIEGQKEAVETIVVCKNVEAKKYR